MIELQVRGVTLDMKTNIPLVILESQKINEKKYTLPIWIGQFEAQAIARELSETETDRPMTHELLYDVIEQLDSELDQVQITEYEDTTFFAQLILTNSYGDIVQVDSRPSDAICLALRSNSPIYVCQSILDEIGSLDIIEGESNTFSMESDTAFKDFVKTVKASDFTLEGR